LPMLAELEGRLHQSARGAVSLDLRARHGLAVTLHELGLGVEAVEVRKAAVEVEKDDLLGFGREVRLAAGGGAKAVREAHETETGPHELYGFTAGDHHLTTS